MTRRLHLLLTLALCTALTTLTFAPAQAQERAAKLKRLIDQGKVDLPSSGGLSSGGPASALRERSGTPSEAPPVELSSSVPGAKGFGIQVFNSGNEFAEIALDDPSSTTVIGTGATDPSFPGAGTTSPDGSSMYIIYGSTLYDFDPETGTFTQIGDLGTSVNFQGMALDDDAGVYYGITGNNNTAALYTIDVTSATATLVDSVSAVGFPIALAYDEDADSLYTYGLDDTFYSVDKSTAAATAIGPIGFDANHAQGMAYDEGSHQLYMAAFNETTNTGQLRTVDTATGSTTLIGPITLNGNTAELSQLGTTFEPTSGPSLALTPASVDFGLVPPGQSDTQTITLSSVGTEDVDVTDISLSGTDTGQFSISDAPSTPITIPAGGSETVDVTFAPGSTGDFSASLDVTSNDDGAPGTVTSAPLSGTGGSVNFGGPGAGGYFFANSTDEADNSSLVAPGVVTLDIPSGNVNDITGDFGDDSVEGPFAIGFDFVYFGQTYNEFCLSSNGWFTLQNTGDSCPTSSALGNDPIPSSDTPNNVVAWFWDDLDPPGPPNTEITYGQDEDGGLILSFEEVSDFPDDPGNTISADVKLYQSDDASTNGNIRMQYYSVTGAFDSTGATIGIENAAGDAGIQYRLDDEAQNGPVLDAGQPLALMFGPDPAALPVELTGFSGTVSDGGVDLSWRTLSEENNRGFQVEMQRHRTAADDSSQPDAWRQVGFVESAAPGGTSTEAQTYALRVADLDAGDYTFRLKQVDLDGLPTVFSDQLVEASIGLDGTYELSSAYPNPFRDRATFEIAVREAQHVTVEVFDVLGRRVMEVFDGALEGGTAQTITVEAAGLSSGVYFYRVTGEDFTAAKKMMLVR